MFVKGTRFKQVCQLLLSLTVEPFTYESFRGREVKLVDLKQNTV